MIKRFKDIWHSFKFKFIPLSLFVYIIIFILFFLLCFVRYFIPRLPKDIPYSLNEFYFYIFLSICISYSYAVYRSIYPKNPPQFLINILFAIADKFTVIQNKIFFHPKIYPIYYKILFKVLIPKIFALSFENKERLFITGKYFPRIFLLCILISDILIFHKIKIFYHCLPIYIISFFFDYVVATIKRGREYQIQRLENRYKSVSIREEGNPVPMFIWDEIIEKFGKEKFEKLTFKEKCEILTHKNEKDNVLFLSGDYDIVKHNPNAIFHCTEGSTTIINTYKASIRDYLIILFERDLEYDENDPENDYLYTGYPSCHDHIYENYKRNNSIEKLSSENYEELRKEFHEIVKILVPVVYSVIDTLERFENRKSLKKISTYIYLFTGICWLFVLTISYYVFPCDFELTLYIIDLLLNNYPKDDPYSLLNFIDSLTFDIAWADICNILVYIKYQGLIPFKIFISYIIFKCYMLFIHKTQGKSKINKRRRRKLYRSKAVKKIL